MTKRSFFNGRAPAASFSAFSTIALIARSSRLRRTNRRSASECAERLGRPSTIRPWSLVTTRTETAPHAVRTSSRTATPPAEATHRRFLVTSDQHRRPIRPTSMEFSRATPVEPVAESSVEEVHGYRRPLTILYVAMAGQKRPKSAEVPVVGAGGLGSPALMYLAAAGVATLGTIDHATLDEASSSARSYWPVRRGSVEAESAGRPGDQPHDRGVTAHRAPRLLQPDGDPRPHATGSWTAPTT